MIVKEEFQPAPEDANRPIGSERAFLKAREQNLDLESKIGKTQIVSVEAAAPGTLPNGAAQPGNLNKPLDEITSVIRMVL